MGIIYSFNYQNHHFCRLPMNSIQGSIIGPKKMMVLVVNGMIWDLGPRPSA